MIPLDILDNFRSWLAERGARGVADWVAEGGLRLQEFTALMGVSGDGVALKRLLDAHDAAAPSPYADVQGLHSLRWILFNPELKNTSSDSPKAEAQAPVAPVQALVLSFVFEGDADDALEELIARAKVEPILRYCKGFRVDDDAAKYLMSHRIKSGYMFRDLGPLQPPDRYMPDATISEIEDAREVEEEFETYYAAIAKSLLDEIKPEQDRSLRDEIEPERDKSLLGTFLKAFGDEAFKLRLTDVERRVPDEARWVRRASALIRRLQAQAARRDPKGAIRRGVHAKAHGLLKATFEISGPEKIPLKYRVGIFAIPGQKFDAHLRPSNGAHMVGSDRTPDARGLAISLDVPFGEGCCARTFDDFFLQPEGATMGRQDFVLMSHPTFFVPDIRRLAVLMSILAAKSPATKFGRAFAFALGSGSFSQLVIAGRTFMKRVTHPLAAEFSSTTPYSLGDDYIVKYSVELDDRTRLNQLGRERVQNFLSDALRDSLEAQPIELGFYLHVLAKNVVPAGKRSISDVVEDATLDWKALGAEKVRAATIRIGPQDPTGQTELFQAEDWEFNPWHALAVHRPLGSLNRARLSIYPASVQFRKGEERRVSVVPVSGARSTPPRGLTEAAE
jgi:hypothetical protein